MQHRYLDYLQRAGDYVAPYMVMANQFLTDHVDVVAAIAVGAVFVLSVQTIKHRRAASKRERVKAMTDRGAKVKSKLADGIINLLDDMFLNNEMSGQERKKWIATFSHCFDIKDLAPKAKPHQPTLIKTIAARLGHSKPAKIPGPAPGEVVPFTPPKERKVKTKDFLKQLKIM